MDEKPFNELLDSVREAGRIARGEQPAARAFPPAEPEVTAIRGKTGLSRAEFAALVGVSVRTLRNWEQGHRHPAGPARVLLKVVAADPQGVLKALRGKAAA